MKTLGWLLAGGALSGEVALMMVSTTQSAAADAERQVLRHLVLYKFKPEASKAQLQEVIDAFAGLPAKIDALEQEQSQITAALANAALYRDQPEQVRQLNQRYAAIEAELASALSRWEELERKR